LASRRAPAAPRLTAARANPRTSRAPRAEPGTEAAAEQVLAESGLSEERQAELMRKVEDIRANRDRKAKLRAKYSAYVQGQGACAAAAAAARGEGLSGRGFRAEGVSCGRSNCTSLAVKWPPSFGAAADAPPPRLSNPPTPAGGAEAVKPGANGTDYARWDMWCPSDEEDDMINGLTPNNPQFRAMERDIEERHKRCAPRSLHICVCACACVCFQLLGAAAVSLLCCSPCFLGGCFFLAAASNRKAGSQRLAALAAPPSQRDAG